MTQLQQLDKNTLFNTIKARRSVRTFDGNGLAPEEQKELLDFANGVENPYGQQAVFQIFSAKEHGLASPVIAGTDLYMTGKLKKQPHAEEAFGYSFELVVLQAQAMGIGTTWIAGTMNRDAFEKASALAPDEVMPCVSPLGYPAKKMALRESLMRKGVKADSRLPYGQLFFDGDFGKPLARAEGDAVSDALEAVRWAPSAVNKQPWRVVVCGDLVHFYEKQDKGYENNGWDLQKVDLGIALCHFDRMMKAAGRQTEWKFEDPGIQTPPAVRYIAAIAWK
ncbi:MAG: nitroreductase family protein [Firmicutes bacterium]|nr:nitroreductase family protein [Bacillota bacterium]